MGTFLTASSCTCSLESSLKGMGTHRMVCREEGLSCVSVPGTVHASCVCPGKVQQMRRGCWVGDQVGSLATLWWLTVVGGDSCSTEACTGDSVSCFLLGLWDPGFSK